MFIWPKPLSLSNRRRRSWEWSDHTPAVYGILHVVLYPVLLFVAFIPVLLSLGLFIFVINAFLLFLTSALLDNFQIDNIPTALVGAVSLTILNGIWRWLLF